MKPQITITIKGAAGAGKSTLALYLGNLLKRHGVAVTVYDDGGLGEHSLNEKRLELADYFNASVVINVEQK